MHYRSWALSLIMAIVFAAAFASCGDDDNDDRFGDCGNGIVAGGEECDDGNNSDNDDCLSTCVDATCGDGFLNENDEECDGSNLGGETCTSLGESSGTLRCDDDCTFDTSGCDGGSANPTATPTPEPAVTPTAMSSGIVIPTATSTPPPGGGATCQSGDSITARVNLSPDFGGAVVSVKYPASANIPGNGGASSVTDRVTFAPSGGFQSANDQDSNGDLTDDTITASFAGTTLTPAGTFVTIAFDCTAGASAPSPSDFTCVVESGSDDQGNPLTLGCTLAVTGP